MGADEELLDEKDSNQVKKSVALDSFNMFNECVQNVYNSRGPKLNAKEVIRLQTALLDFSMKCYKGNLEQITLCLRNCVLAMQQARDNVSLMMGGGGQQQQQQFHNGAVAGGSIDRIQYQQDSALVSKFIGMLDNSDTDILFGMLDVARIHLSTGRNHASTAHVALVFASLKVARRIFNDEEQEQEQCDDDDNDAGDDDCDDPSPSEEESLPTNVVVPVVKADDIDEAAKAGPVTAKEKDATATTDDDGADDVEGSNEMERETTKTDEKIEDEKNNNCDTTNGDDTDKKEKA